MPALVAVYVATMTAGSGAPQLDVVISWNDGSTRNQTVISQHLLNALVQSNGEVELYLAAGQNVTYQATVTGSGAPPLHYMLRIRAEPI